MTTRPLTSLVFDDAVYPRLQRNDGRVRQLIDVLEAGQSLPPVLVERTSGIVLGGRHTAGAYEARGAIDVPIKLVDVAPADRLLYAYRQDARAALPYGDADVRKVARLEYERRRGNGGATAEAIAKDLGRSPRTVQSWVTDLIERDERERELQRHARIVAVQAFIAAGISQRRIAAYIGVTQMQVRRDGNIAATSHFLNDSRIVSAAESIIHLAIGQGATKEEVAAARRWLLERTQPEVLEANVTRKLLSDYESDLYRAAELLEASAARAVVNPVAVDRLFYIDERARILSLCDEICRLTESIRKQVPDAQETETV